MCIQILQNIHGLKKAKLGRLTPVFLDNYFSEIDIWVPEPDHSEVPADWWDTEADKSLLIGVFKHGE